MEGLDWYGDKAGSYYLKSDPQPNWLFDITFMSDKPLDLSDKLNNCIPISFTLPQHTTTYVERYCLGIKKSVPVARDYSGDSQMEFIIRTENSENDYLKELGNVHENILDEFKHLEQDRTYNKIEVKMYSRALNKGKVTIYTYYNVILTEMTLGEISYEGEEAVKASMTYHYDYWTVREEGQN